jgi:translation initiation factor IF-1
VTGLTISREGWYRALRNIGCWRGSERPFFYHHVHDLRCGVRPSRGVANVKWFGLSRSRRAAKTGSTINHEIEPIEIAPLCDSEEVASLRDIKEHSVPKELQFEGLVTEILPDARYRVRLDNGHQLVAYTAGRMKKNRIKTLVGDRVTVEVSPYDLEKGRLIFRHKDERAGSLGHQPRRHQFRRR